MIHELKIRKEFADAVYSGRKTFEYRFDDRGFWVDDEIVFDVRDENDNKVQHPLNDELYRITYVLSETNFDKIPKGWAVLGIKPVDSEVTKIIRSELGVQDKYDLKDILRLEVARRREELKITAEDNPGLVSLAQFRLETAKRLYKILVEERTERWQEWTEHQCLKNSETT